MRAYLTFAQAATAHQDGTVSILRSGINIVWSAPDQPVVMDGAVVGRIQMDPEDRGPHKFEIKAADTADGKELLPNISGEFEAPTDGGFLNLLFNVAFTLPKPVKFDFELVVDQQKLAAWRVSCALRDQAPS